MKKTEEILLKIQNGEYTAKQAYKELFGEKITLGKRAHFVKLKVYVKDEGRGLNMLLKVIFALPIPIVLVKIILKLVSKHANTNNVDIDMIGKMLKYAKHSKLELEAEDAIVKVRVI